MRLSHGLVLGSTLLAGVAIGLLAAPGRGAAAPVEDFAGSFTGKLAHKDLVIDPDNADPGKSTNLATATFAQNGFDIGGTIQLDDESATIFDVQGRGGNGHFWLGGSSADGTIVLAGTATGQPGKRTLKAKGVFVGDSNYSTVSLTVKESNL